MKDKISKIVGKYRHSSFDTAEERKEKWVRCADELSALMCYREVRAYYLAYNDFHGELSWEEFTAEVEGHFFEEYDGNGELIRQAIQQVKNEQK